MADSKYKRSLKERKKELLKYFLSEDELKNLKKKNKKRKKSKDLEGNKKPKSLSEMDKKLVNIVRDEQKKLQYLKDLTASVQEILNEYFKVSSRGWDFDGRDVPLLYGLLSIALEGSTKIYFISKQFDDFIRISPTRRTLGTLKGKIKKRVHTNIKNCLDYLVFIRNHYVHFPLYYASFYDDEGIFLGTISYFLKEGEVFGHLDLELQGRLNEYDKYWE